MASRAGVSTATVSRFYNNPGVVAPATAERIREAIEATGYLPNLIAGGLASNRSRLVAVLVPEVAQSIFNDTIEAMSAELALDGNIVMLGLDRRGQYPHAAADRRRTGAARRRHNPDRHRHRCGNARALRQRDITVIETWGIPEEPIDIAVGFSHPAVGRDIARFLLGRGYTHPLVTVANGARARAAPRWIHR